ncbi:MAG: molybdopterin-dependent oxidoreductase [Gammaproteobacteria bacterium]|nr:molybdopterin-dependent oxidoreductase [Gammaproteobacteria bacterium]
MPLIDFTLNCEQRQVEANPDVPLLYVLRSLGIAGPKLGCTAEQCGACRILADGDPIYSCTRPVGDVRGRHLETAAGIDSPVRQALIAANATQCGYCLPGIVVAAEALFRRNPQPSRQEIETALDDQLCRCGSHPRVLRALGAIPHSQPKPLRWKSPINTDRKLPPTLEAEPALDRWIAIAPGRILAMTGKVELGQGVLTALRLIVAEELDVDVGRVRMVSAETGATPNEGITAGSMSLETSGAALRQAAAWARRLMLSAAGQELGVPVDTMTVTDGQITAPGINQPMDYWRAHAGRFDFDIVEVTPEKDPAHYRLVGRGHHQRLDIDAKARGSHVFVQDLRADLHARVVRPPSLNHRLERLDVELTSPAELVVDGSFVAVAHPHEHAATVLAGRMRDRAVWHQVREIGTDGSLSEHLLRHGIDTPSPEPPSLVEKSSTDGGRVRATYSRPFIMHGSLAPSAAWARFDNGRLHVRCASQGIEPFRGVLARVLDMPPEDITVAHVDGSGCYGHNGADDAALDAALVARKLPGRAILVQWRREDEHAFEPYGPAMRIDLAANVSESGHVLDWRHDVWSFPHGGRPSPASPGVDLLAAWHLEKPFNSSLAVTGSATAGGMDRNAEPLYRFPRQEVVSHPVADSPLRTSSLRSLGAQMNVFAIESFMDELAFAADVDPVEFRRRHLAHDARATRLVDAALELSGGLQGPRGMAIARYKNQQSCVAIVLEVSVSDDASIKVRRVWIAADAGRTVDPDGLVNQLEGGTVQALSWCLKEAVAFDADGVTSVDWSSYPILRFTEIPRMETVILDYPGLDPLGAGEATMGPASAALANAVFAATGVRLRDLPMTPDRLRDAAARG